jgi:hypothetical protein
MKEIQMETVLENNDFYEALKRADKSEGVINPGDKTERFPFAASLFKYDEKSYEALKQLISEDGGVIKPVFAVKTKGTVLVIDGWHRVLASKELDIPCPAVFYKGLSEAQMENAALNLNLSGRKMKPKERREIAITLYEQYRWGYGRISRAIGDNNKSSVQAWITTYKKKQGESVGAVNDGEMEIGRISELLRRALKRLQGYYDVSRFMGVPVSENNTEKLKEIVMSLLDTINERGEV